MLEMLTMQVNSHCVHYMLFLPSDKVSRYSENISRRMQLPRFNISLLALNLPCDPIPDNGFPNKINIGLLDTLRQRNRSYSHPNKKCS
jgi:hypothetical protein